MDYIYKLTSIEFDRHYVYDNVYIYKWGRM